MTSSNDDIEHNNKANHTHHQSSRHVVSNPNQSTTVPVVEVNNASTINARSSTCTDDDRSQLIIFLYAFIIMCGIIALWVYDDSRKHPEYSITMHDDYQFPMVTKEAGVTFYVKSREEFDKICPVGSSERADIEKEIMEKYLKYALKHCDREEKEHALHQDFQTPTCDKLHSLGLLLQS